MHTFNSLVKWRDYRHVNLGEGVTLGFVPTMGALHKGHLSLINRSVAENDRTVVSIFVNTTQFNDLNDLNNYPRDLQKDQKLLNNGGVDCLILPAYDSIYPYNYRYRVTENEFSRVMEGAYRTSHFDGVLTVVMKLLNLVRPTRAYFGEKDYQQYCLIRDMVNAFFMDVEIVRCPTVRKKDGLAASSRNLLLNDNERKLAPLFYEVLNSKNSLQKIRDILEASGFNVDYIEEWDGRRFGAVHMGEVRLIDNVRS